jgi:hypothetical protein
MELILKHLIENVGPSGREVISLQKEDSLLVILNVREAKKVSARLHPQN